MRRLDEHRHLTGAVGHRVRETLQLVLQSLAFSG